MTSTQFDAVEFLAITNQAAEVWPQHHLEWLQAARKALAAGEPPEILRRQYLTTKDGRPGMGMVQ